MQPEELGDFRISNVLGQGGSGTVYDAQWGPRRVALKVLHADLVSGERGRAQFLAEAKRLQAISHPSVVKVLAVGELPDGRPYLAMERLEGEPLASVLARGAMSLTDALGLFGELCAAVAALHDQGLVHRDLKPENVFVVDGAHAVLLDFGIAKELEAPPGTTTSDGGVRGTPAYMAPERFFGQPAGIATDVYELAVTLYAMLAGRLPWDDVGDPEARLAPRPLVEVASVSSELDVEIRRAMSTRAQNRPTSALALLEAVRVAAAAPVTQASETARMKSAGNEWFASRHTTTDRGKTPLAWAPAEREQPAPVKRRKRWPFVLGALALAGGGGGALAWQLSGDDDEPLPAAALVAPDAATLPDAAVVADPWSGDAAPVASVIADPNDPWAAERPAAPPLPVIERSGPIVSTEQARKEMIASLQHVPADTRVVFAVSVGELRAHEQFDDILGRIRNQTLIKALFATTPPCVSALIAGSEWAVFASQSLTDAHNATLILRGRWTRGDVEKCFAEDAKPLAMPDGKIMLELPRVGWADFLDEHTAYISVRDDLGAAQVHGLVVRGSGPTPHAKQLLAKLPAERSLFVVADGTGKLEWPGGYFPQGSDLVGWLRVDTYSELEILVDTHSEQDAKSVVALVKPEFDKIFDNNKASDFLGWLKVDRVKTAMRIRGRLSTLLVSMIGAQIP